MMHRLDKKMLQWELFLSQTAKKGRNKETLKQRSCISVCKVRRIKTIILARSLSQLSLDFKLVNNIDRNSDNGSFQMDLPTC